MGALRAAHRRFIRGNRAAFDREIGERVKVQSHVREHAGFTHRTGAAIRDVRTRIIRMKSGVKMRITNVARHARILEFGSRAHVIAARKAKYLTFRAGGARVFRKRVWHPGTPPYWFMRSAAQHAHTELGPHLRAAFTRLAKRF